MSESKLHWAGLGLALAVFLATAPSLTGVALAGEYEYPDARTEKVTDDYHGTEVTDAYRWLEDPDTPEARTWIEAENELTYDFLGGIPQRDALRDRLTELWNYERYSAPYKRGDRYFFSKNDGLQNHAVLYVMDGIDGEPRVLIDPNTLSEDGTVALARKSYSKDGRYMAWASSEGGSDWRTWRVRDVDTGKDLDDVINWSKFSGASFADDNSGFYYSRYDEPEEGDELEQANYYQKLYFHKLGTPQSEDVLVYERRDHKNWGFYGSVTEDGRYLIIHVSQGTDNRNRIFYKDLEGDDTVVELLNDFDADYDFEGNDGTMFFFSTDLDAPKSRIIAVDTANPARENWRTIVPQQEDALSSVSLVGDTFYCEYIHHARDQVRKFDTAGKDLGVVELPGVGTLYGFGGHREDTEFFYTFTTFTVPSSIYRYDTTTGQSTLFREPELNFDFSPYETTQVFYQSKDGTKVPMFIVHKKGIELDGSHPTYLYGYGGFNISMMPRFSTSRLAWLEMGGIYAQACLRGGGEYGEEWHDAGSLLNKQNTFDDFIAAGEYLIEEGYTSTPRLAIAGGSNGGLLVGACLNQRPDLFGAALPAVGVMDMLRFHTWTIGWAWTSDYGSSEDPEQFEVLYTYSPYHNIVDGTNYPATFITTADHDDRVVPAHSFKYAARLQAAQGGDAPILIRIQTRAGHGAGKPTSMRIQEEADRWAFLVKVMGLDVGGI